MVEGCRAASSLFRWAEVLRGEQQSLVSGGVFFKGYHDFEEDDAVIDLMLSWMSWRRPRW